MKFSLPLCAFVLLCGSAYAQQTATTADGKRVVLKDDHTWQYADASSSGVSLKIEAGIAYKLGGVQPVARTAFVLLDANPIPELVKLPPAYTRGLANAAEEMALRCGKDMPDAMAVIQKHTRYSVTTGFDGKAEFAGVRPGKYWVFGATETRSGCAFWLREIELTKSENMALDQNNAVMVR